MRTDFLKEIASQKDPRNFMPQLSKNRLPKERVCAGSNRAFGEMAGLDRSRMNQTRHTSDRGQKIYLILAVVSAVALVVALDWRMRQKSPPAEVGRGVDFFAGLKTVLGMFQVDYGRYPTTEEAPGDSVAFPGGNARSAYFSEREAHRERK